MSAGFGATQAHAVSPAGSTFVPITPFSAFDSRPITYVANGGRPAGKLPANSTSLITIGGRGGVPADGSVSAVVVQLGGWFPARDMSGMTVW
ncbi:MAG: hypothetical protein WCH93_10985, partial [Actinomycetota bacterium]